MGISTTAPLSWDCPQFILSNCMWLADTTLDRAGQMGDMGSLGCGRGRMTLTLQCRRQSSGRNRGWVSGPEPPGQECLLHTAPQPGTWGQKEEITASRVLTSVLTDQAVNTSTVLNTTLKHRAHLYHLCNDHTVCDMFVTNFVLKTHLWAGHFREHQYSHKGVFCAEIWREGG